MKKIITLLMSIVMILSMTSCKKEEVVDNTPSDYTYDADPDYEPGKWITDNVSLKFYFIYSESKDNDLITVKVKGDKASIITVKDSGEQLNETYYIQDGEDVYAYNIIEVDGKKRAFEKIYKDTTFKKLIPRLYITTHTVDLRRISNPLKTMTFVEETKIADRVALKYLFDGDYYRRELYIDKESGMILKEYSEDVYDGVVTQTQTNVVVTELAYGSVSDDEVSVDLSKYEISDLDDLNIVF